MTYLNELQELRFKNTPGGNEELLLFGKKVYTSETLRVNVKKVCKKYLPTISSIVIKLIDNKKLIPVFRSKGIIDYIKNKKKLKNHSLGVTSKDKIYIFLDSHYSLLKLSSINEKELSITIIHELIHLADNLNRQKFFKLNYKYYIKFFKEFFSNYLAVEKKDITNKVIDNIFKKLIEAEKKGIINFIEVYSPIFKSLENFTAYTNDEYGDIYWQFVKFLDQQYISFSPSVPGDIWESGRIAYLEITKGKNKTLRQEFWNPAEIISIIAEINPKHPSVVNSINLLK